MRAPTLFALGALSACLAVVACTASDETAATPSEPDGGNPSSSSGGSSGTGESPGGPDDTGPGPSDAGGDAGCVRPDPGTKGDGDVTIGPAYKPAPENTPPKGTPLGTVYGFEMKASDSKIYPPTGLTGTTDTRAVWIYVPKQYVDGTAAPILIVQDGTSYYKRVVPVLDTMIAAKRLPPMIGIFIHHGGGDGRGSERGLEYDRLSEDYSKFVESEVLPIIPKNADILKTYKNLRFTKDPEGRATMGISSGGSAAFTMAWFRPDLYRRVLTFSGTFVNQYPETAYPNGAWDYHTHLIKDAPAKPIRVHLEVGDNDNNLDATFKDGMHNWITANEAMAKVLKEKAYHYHFDFAKSAVHGDNNVILQTLPATLEWLWRGYTACPAEP